MRKSLLSLLLLSALSIGLCSCASTATPPQNQQVFGQADSTIPWNQPQSWEGQAGGFNAMRGGDEGH